MKAMETWVRANPVIVVAVLVLLDLAGIVLAGFIASKQSDVNDSLHNTTAQNRAAIVSLIRVEDRACRQDHKLRVQYKIRGQNERDILNGLIDLLSIKPQPGQKVDPKVLHLVHQKIKGFRHDAGRIHIIPVPNCDEFAKELTKGFNRAFLLQK